MKPDKYFERDKKLIKLKKERNKIISSIRNADWVKYNKPVRDGYYLTYVLTDDVLNRKDTHVYQEVLNLTNIKVWGKEKNKLLKDYNVHHNKTELLSNWHLSFDLKKINQTQYDALSDEVKKLFFIHKTNHLESTKTYKTSLFKYQYSPKIIKAYFTHYREVNGELQRQLSETDKALNIVLNGNLENNDKDGWLTSERDIKNHKNKVKALKDVKEILEDSFDNKIFSNILIK